MYQHYGDRRILEENYEGLKKYVEFLRTRAKSGILKYSNAGDWVALEKTPGDLVSSFFYYYGVDLQRKIAQILGKNEDYRLA